MSEKIFTFEMEGMNAVGKLDIDRDGEPSLKATIYGSEAIQELVAREDAVAGVKVATVDIDGLLITAKIDTDKDGEQVADIVLDLSEILSEGLAALKDKFLNKIVG